MRDVQDQLILVQELVLAQHTEPRRLASDTEPALASRRPLRMLSSVVLPEPFAPTSP